VKVQSPHFHDHIPGALADQNLQYALGKLATGFPVKRKEAAAKLPEFDALRDHARDIKNHVLENLDSYLDHYEAQVVAAGGAVHWCATAEDACAEILKICRSVNAKTVTKSKTMIGEEIAINDYLADHGVEPVETDLGEYIIQLRNEPPSHIIAPAIHLTKGQVADTFRHHHQDLDPARALEEPRVMLDEARARLRGRFVAADVGITGANMLVAESGTNILVTNEGNAELTYGLPRVHIVIASIEKIVPTFEDATTILRVLARSATGQEITVYTSFCTGPKRPTDVDGPDEYHVILLDNGRSKMLGSEFQDMLRCIRCGACINHCPVYGALGGHAYGWVYPGPMGSVLTPALVGIDDSKHLPNASTLCGRCESVCPMRIPLPRMLRAWREKAVEAAGPGTTQARGLRLWAWFAARPATYRLVFGLGTFALSLLGGLKGRFRRLPLLGGWTKTRDLPAPQAQSFQMQWRQQAAMQGRKTHPNQDSAP